MTIKKIGFLVLNSEAKVLIIKHNKKWGLPVYEATELSEAQNRLFANFAHPLYPAVSLCKEFDGLQLNLGWTSSGDCSLSLQSELQDARYASLEELWYLVALPDSLQIAIKKLIERTRT